jgi:glycosyltransferase involved in cell wall biosynthesis
VSAPVAVIVPVLDAGALLERALRSIEAQTLAPREIVVVDDGSTDPATLALLDDVARRPGVALHRTPNRGPAAARNLAIERASAPFILPLDADDHLAPTFLERTVPLLSERSDLDVVHTWVGLVGRHRGVWRTGDFALPALLARCTVHVTSLFRRTLWERVGGFDTAFTDGAEDWDFWLSAAAAGARAEGIAEVLTYYHRGPGSRERAARARGTSRDLMAKLATKHRRLYETHLTDALALLYEEYAGTADALERVYEHPLLRLATAWRARRTGRP